MDSFRSVWKGARRGQRKRLLQQTKDTRYPSAVLNTISGGFSGGGCSASKRGDDSRGVGV